MSYPVMEPVIKRLWVKKSWTSRKVVVGAEDTGKGAASALKKLEREVVARILIEGPDFVIDSYS